MAISIEKYATTPEIGNVSYEKGLDEVGCIGFLSPRRFKSAKATNYEWESRRATGPKTPLPLFIGSNTFRF
jgi:hypothetical protein